MLCLLKGVCVCGFKASVCRGISSVLLVVCSKLKAQLIECDYLPGNSPAMEEWVGDFSWVS